jgi:hypothetical protein
MAKEILVLMRNVGVHDCTTKRQNTHSSDMREVQYPFHPWYGRRVQVEAVRNRNGPVVFRCRVDDGGGFPALEIPTWMFDERACFGMELKISIAVRCGALRNVRALLAEAQPSSWIPGGTDEEAVETGRRSARFIPDTYPDPGVVEGTKPEDRDSTDANAARTRREVSPSRGGGKR